MPFMRIVNRVLQKARERMDTPESKNIKKTLLVDAESKMTTCLSCKHLAYPTVCSKHQFLMTLEESKNKTCIEHLYESFLD